MYSVAQCVSYDLRVGCTCFLYRDHSPLNMQNRTKTRPTCLLRKKSQPVSIIILVLVSLS